MLALLIVCISPKLLNIWASPFGPLALRAELLSRFTCMTEPLARGPYIAPARTFKVGLVGTSKNSASSPNAIKLPANDSASFSFRFIYVHSGAVSDRQWEQFFEVPTCDFDSAPCLTMMVSPRGKTL